MGLVWMRGTCTPYCDWCGAELPAQPDFRSALEAKRRAGWQIRRLADGRYDDMCRECRNNGKEGQDGYR